MPLKSFEDSLKDHAEKFSPSVTPSNWDAIANALPAEKHKKRAVWLWFIAAGIFALIAVGIVSYQSPVKANAPAVTATNNNNSSTPNLPTNSSGSSAEQVINSTPSTTSLIQDKTPDNRPAIKPPVKIAYIPSSPQVKFTEMIDCPGIGSNALHEDALMSNESITNDTILMAETIVSTVDSPQLDTVRMMTISKAEIKKNQSRHIKKYIGFEASYLYTDTRIKVNQAGVASFAGPSPLNNPNEQLRNQTDRSLPGFQIGINYCLQRKFTYIKTGLYYKNIRYDIQVYNVNLNSLTSNNRFNDFDFNKSDSFAAGNGGLVKNSFHYLNVPLEIWRETFSMNRWHFNYGGGLNANVFIGNKGVNHQASGFYVKSEKADRSVISPFHLSATAGMGVSYDAGQYYALYIRALYTRSLAPIESSHVTTNYQNIGLSAGIKYLIK